MPKTKYTKEAILEKSILIAKEKGIDQLNVRLVASELGCSVAPIYTAYQNFDNLITEVEEHFRLTLKSFINRNYSQNDFFNMGLGLVDFTLRYPNVFMYLYKHTEDFYDILSDEENLIDLMNQSHLNKLLNEEELKYLLDSMSIFTQGLCMSIVLKPDSITLKEAFKKLNMVGGDLVESTLRRKGKLEQYICLVEEGK